MIKITLICLGKLKESYLREACAEYIKRLGAFCATDIVELAPARLPDNPSAAQISAALSAEAVQILKNMPPRSRVYALCIEGTELTSESLAAAIKSDAAGGAGNITFIIGSSYGLDNEIKSRADIKLSMSKMTFPHQLARVMLLEQLYRAFHINSGGKYHK